MVRTERLQLELMRKIRILLTDDDTHLRLMMRHVLASLGMDVVAEAEDGEQAIALYRQHQPDLVLLDIMMPKLTGKEALLAIRTEFPQAVVIMLSSLNDIDTVQACLDAGAANYIQKGSALEEIKACILETWEAYQ